MKISDALQLVQFLYVETSPFIHFVEQYPAYIERMHAIFRLVSQRKLELVTSVITLTETLAKPIQSTDAVLEREYRELFLKARNTRLIPVNTAIASRAAHLRAQYNLKTPDALQVATALETSCDAFLTNDLGIKRVTELSILIVDELELDPPIPETSA